MTSWLNHSSILGHLGKYGQKISDPLAVIGGDKWTHLTSDVLPEKVNAGLSTVMKPFEAVDKKVNPVRKIPGVDRFQDIVAQKPGDALAIAAGAFFGGSALLGGGGAGGAGGGAAVAPEGGATAMGPAAGELGAVDSSAASTQLGLTAADVGGGGGSGAAGGAGGAGAQSWQDYAKQYGNLGRGQQQQQQRQSDDPEQTQQDWEGASRQLQRNQLMQRAQVLRQMIAQVRNQQQPY